MIDWKALATEVGSLRGDGEIGGDHLARAALTRVIGDDEWRAAVDYYVSLARGSELTRSVLWLLRPPAAMERCREIIASTVERDRETAAELLRVVGDARIVPWIAGYLADANESVQNNAAGMVDQLLWSDLVEPEACADLLATMRVHASEGVRERAAFIDSFLAKRES
jgi:hypothetical protein